MPKGSPCKAYTCSACGGEWFREADYYPFRPEKDLVTWPGWPELIGQASVARMTVGVCLCGTPLDPLIGGMRGGYTPNAELGRFFKSLEAGKRVLKAIFDAPSIIAAAVGGLVSSEEMANLQKRLRKLCKLGSLERSGPGPRWVLPGFRAPLGKAYLDLACRKLNPL